MADYRHPKDFRLVVGTIFDGVAEYLGFTRDDFSSDEYTQACSRFYLTADSIAKNGTAATPQTVAIDYFHELPGRAGQHYAQAPEEEKAVMITAFGDAFAQAIAVLDPTPTKKKPGRPPQSEILTLALLQDLIASRGETVRIDIITGKLSVTGYQGDITESELSANYVCELWESVRQMYKGTSRDTVQGLFDLLLSHKSVKYNTVLAWIKSREWDGTDRIGDTVHNILHLPETDDLSATLIRKWFWQGIALLHNGGQYGTFGADGILVLVGEQGCGKTSFFRHIAGGGKRTEWYISDGQLDNWDKDKERRCITKWICELGEMQRTLNRADVETMKQFITRGLDAYRLPYARTDVEKPRYTNIGATVNPDESGYFLIDRTGNRRYWTVAIPAGVSIDFEKITPDYAQQLWRQAYEELFATGDIQSFRILPEERDALEDRNGYRVKQLPSTELLREILNEYESNQVQSRWFTLLQWVAQERKKMYGKELSRYPLRQIGAALNSLGVERVAGHKKTYYYRLPDNRPPDSNSDTDLVPPSEEDMYRDMDK